MKIPKLVIVKAADSTAFKLVLDSTAFNIVLSE